MERTTQTSDNRSSAGGPGLFFRSIWLVLVAVLLGLPLQALAETGEEAERQLAFARQELVDARFDRAVASAGSALRLNPALYEALLVKGLALEGLGDIDRAEALIVAYVELSGELAAPEAAEALERFRAPRTRRGRTRAGGDATSRTAEVALASTDPEALRVEGAEALRAGDCDRVVRIGRAWTASTAGDDEGWRLLGDGHKCAGAFRDAVRAYERYEAAGGSKAGVLALVPGLRSNLATLEVVGVDPGSGHVPALGLALGDEQVAPDGWTDGRVVFADLPAGESLVLGVAGRGFQLATVEVEPLAPGETRTLEIAPAWLGLGTVEVADFPARTCRAFVSGRDGRREVSPSTQHEASAGLVVLEVETEHGTLERLVSLASGGTVRFEPLSQLPAELTLAGLPTGSAVRVFVELASGESFEVESVVPTGGGTLDAETGILVADPWPLHGLMPGNGGLWVSHPVLGEVSQAVVLAPGLNAARVGHGDFPGRGALSERYEQWRVDTLQERRRAMAAPVPPAVVAIGGAITSGILLAAGLDARSGHFAAIQDYDASCAAPGGCDPSLKEDVRRLRDQANDLFLGSGVAGGVGGLGLGVTVGVAVGVRRGLGPKLEWRPEGF